MDINFNELVKQADEIDSETQDTLNDEQIRMLEGSIKESLKFNEHRTRNWLTLSFIVGFFSLIIAASFYVTYHNNELLGLIIEAKKNNVEIDSSGLNFLSFESVYSLIFNSLGTSLGFIIGYYFKEKVTK